MFFLYIRIIITWLNWMIEFFPYFFGFMDIELKMADILLYRIGNKRNSKWPLKDWVLFNSFVYELNVWIKSTLKTWKGRIPLRACAWGTIFKIYTIHMLLYFGFQNFEKIEFSQTFVFYLVNMMAGIWIYIPR